MRKIGNFVVQLSREFNSSSPFSLKAELEVRTSYKYVQNILVRVQFMFFESSCSIGAHNLFD